ncbi:uncharacterized protein LOC141856204 isoform X2 [Brevipalpus obovatus]|uniref:uncharacterized protein LOC141856204 isoform X2 n=1 Tax=Brevipalpus obovatus TaxID=246614 RepID=UPI003D9E215D
MEQMRATDTKLSSCNSAQPYIAKEVAERRSEGELVHLLTYDLSGGLARELSHAILGKQIDAIWHTSILYHGKEYFFGQNGINVVNYNVTAPPMGRPLAKINLGISHIPITLFDEYILTLATSSFRRGTYDLFHHNCNNFSNEVAQFLTGKGVPEEILKLPDEVLSTRLGQLIASSFRNPLENAVNQSINTGSNLFDNFDFEDLSANQSSSSSSVQNRQVDHQKSTTMADDENKEPPPQEDPKDDSAQEEVKPKRKAPKYSDPPIVFKDVDGVNACKKIMELVESSLNDEERRALIDWCDFLKADGEAWKLDDEHLSLITRLLNGEDGKFPPNVPLLTLEILQTAALKDDFVLALHGDRKNHRLMSYIYKIESLTLAEQEEIAKLLCNFCLQPCSFDWLCYISEWNEPDGTPASNCRVTTRVAVHTLLNDKLTTLQRVGVNLIFNLSLRELFEEPATELATAVLQYLHGDIVEEQVYLCLTSLLRFMTISVNEVPALTQMLGPDLSKFKGMSSRVDDLIGQVVTKVAALTARKTEPADD